MATAAVFYQTDNTGHIYAKVGDMVSWKRGQRRLRGTVVQMVKPGDSAAQLKPSDVPKSRWHYPTGPDKIELYMQQTRVVVEIVKGQKKTFYVVPAHRIAQNIFKLEIEKRAQLSLEEEAGHPLSPLLS